MRSAAVIGAGMAGLSAATALAARGVAVTLFDKGRRPGGRIATRRAGGLQFDHGAQYATARTSAFAAVLQTMRDAGAAAPWPAAGADHVVGVPGMSALPAFLQGTLRADWHVGRHVGFLHAAGDGWHVRHLDAAATAPGTVTEAGGEVSGPFDAVLLALPAPQAAPLLRAIGHGYAEAVGRVVIAPCWALMLAFEEPQPGPDAQRPADGAFGWIARDSARPGRAAVPECWVAHARPDWSRAALERPAEAVLAELQVAFASVTGIAATPMHAAVHRWRHAMTETPLGEPCLWDAAARLGVCGDWCLGARVEAAWQSGAALAEGC